MEKTAIFTISKSSVTAKGRRYNVKSLQFNTYNKIDVPEAELYSTLEELTDVFNNVIGYAILFEID